MGKKENSAADQALSKPGPSPSPEINRQWQIHFETLRASAFNIMFKTIRICAHHSYVHSCPIQISDHCTPNSIADRTGGERPKLLRDARLWEASYEGGRP